MGKMKVLILSANIGNFDTAKQHVKQDIECDLLCVTENDGAYELTDRAYGKAVKMGVTGLNYETYYDIIIWIDGNVTITNPSFAKRMVSLLERNDIAISHHPYRKTTGEEYDYILSEIEKGNKYLTERYDPKKLKAEREIIGDDYPLYWCGCFAYWNNQFFHAFGKDWFEHEMQFAMFDQCSFSYFAEAHGMDLGTFYFNGFHKNDYLTVTAHAK
jgi:hypothetical protein